MTSLYWIKALAQLNIILSWTSQCGDKKNHVVIGHAPLKPLTLSTLRPRQNERHFANDIFKCIFLNENVWILIKSSLKFVPKGPINNIPALVQIMAWRRPGDKLLSESMMICLPMHICVTRPQWVNMLNCFIDYKRFIHILYHILGVRRRPDSQWGNATCCLSCTIKTSPADALATEVARASAGIVLTK